MQDLVKEAEKVFHKRETEEEKQEGAGGKRRERTRGIIDKREI